jgi:hypothetical protein
MNNFPTLLFTIAQGTTPSQAEQRVAGGEDFYGSNAAGDASAAAADDGSDELRTLFVSGMSRV